MTVIGKCPLCKVEKPLIESHLMPAFAYKAVKRSTPVQGPHVLISPTITLSHDYQVKDYLLCPSCDQRFGDKERYVSQLIRTTDSNFPILRLIEKMESRVDFAFGRLYQRTGEPTINHSALAYFAASIVWRASVHTWTNFDKSKFRPTPLGPYEESFRQYLNNEAPFPTDAVVWVHVMANEPGVALKTPHRKRIHNVITGVFEVPGIRFYLLVGKSLTSNDRILCVLEGGGNPIWVIDGRRAPMDEGVFKLMSSSRIANSFQRHLKKAA